MLLNFFTNKDLYSLIIPKEDKEMVYPLNMESAF